MLFALMLLLCTFQFRTFTLVCSGAFSSLCPYPCPSLERKWALSVFQCSQERSALNTTALPFVCFRVRFDSALPFLRDNIYSAFTKSPSPPFREL